MDGGKIKEDAIRLPEQKVFHNQPLPELCYFSASYHTTDKFAIARAVLLLCPSRSPKSCSVHVEKVIVFSFCFCSFAFIMSILGDCTLETLPGKCSPLLHCTTTMLACSACCLRCWQLYRAGVEAKKAELKWRRRQLMWRRRIIMKASTKAKLHA